MGRLQAIVLGSALVLFLVLTLATRNAPLHKQLPESSAQPAEEIIPLTAGEVLQNSKGSLDSVLAAKVTALEARLASAKNVTLEAEMLKALSRVWNEAGDFICGGIYAERVAVLIPSDSAWMIAGTTFGIGVNREPDASRRAFGARQAIAAFDQALQLDSTDIEARINKALMFVALSRTDRTVMPMQGILQLREVADQHPEHIGAQLSMGRLSMESGQFDKAIPRFETVVRNAAADPRELLEAHYLMAESYRSMGNLPKAIEEMEVAVSLAEADLKPAMLRELEALKKSAN